MNEPLTDTDHLWVRDLEYIFKYGQRVSPRGMAVFETLAYKSVVSMSDPIIFNPLRRLGYKFMAAEAAWILSGCNDVASISPFSKEIEKFSDDGHTFYGAYGPMILSQFNYVVNTLEADPDTRQAVLTIWRQNPGPSKDIPCTVALQWFVRNKALHCVASMRSSDLWLGHPYDIFNFSAVSFAIMLELNERRWAHDQMPVVLGDLHLTAGSKHLYERNIDAVGRIIEQPPVAATKSTPFQPMRYLSKQDFVDHLWEAAKSDDGAKSLMMKG